MPSSYQQWSTSSTSYTKSTTVAGASGGTRQVLQTTQGHPMGERTWYVPDSISEYLDIGDIKAIGHTGVTGSSWFSIAITSRDADFKTVRLEDTPANLNCAEFRLIRSTSTTPLVNFVDGARLTEADLDKAYRQGIFCAQEVVEDAGGLGNLSSANISLTGTTTVDNLTATGTTSVAALTTTGDVTVPDKIVHSGDTNTAIRFPADDTITCETAGTERMRIDSNGKLLVGSTSNTTSRMVSVADLSAMHTLTLQNSADNTGNIFTRHQNHLGQDCGNIIQSGATTISYGTSSDYRLKENVSYDFDATTRLKQLKPARFNFIADGTDKVVDGFLAHEAQTVVPEAVFGEKDAVDDNGNPIIQQIDQSKLVPLLVKTIQELEARIATLEAQ